MGEPLEWRHGLGPKQIHAIRRRFQGLNRDRLRRILADLSPRQQESIQLLPLLFHLNHPLLPGYVVKEVPSGLPDYLPPKPVIAIAKRIARSFAYERRALPSYPIQGLFLMGSMGSVAQSLRSDFDVWLCHDPALPPPALELLQRKIDRIEAWAATRELEVHIFLVDADAFRQGNKPGLTAESAGSTQHHLLLEEFYRSGLRLAGRYPLWWLVPPDQERNYRDVTRALTERRFVDPIDVLDFGGLDATPAEEFVGAALWQIYKGIESPYKAILKLLLMEAYARDYPQPRWVAQSLKQKVYAGETDLSALDAYIEMYRHVEHYLQQRDESERLELARRCLYFKVGEQLSRPSRSRGWRADDMLALTREWGWGQSALIMLDQRPEWKIDQVLNERNLLVRELSHSYRMLTDFARAHGVEHRIDPHELHLLGRTLYAALERRPGKIERINPGISSDLSEPAVSLHAIRTRDGRPAWALYRGACNPLEASDQKPVKTTPGLVELLAWCHVNGIVGRRSGVLLYPGTTTASKSEVDNLLDALRELFPQPGLPPVEMAALGRPPQALTLAAFVNSGSDPLAHLSREGMQITTERSDALSFGGLHTSLAREIELLSFTSWGELLVQRFSGRDGLLDALCHALDLTARDPDGAATTARSYSFSTARGPLIARRVGEVFNAAIGAFRDGPGGDSRYLLQIHDGYHLIQRGEQGFYWLELESQHAVVDELCQPLARFRTTVIDPMVLAGSRYHSLYALNRPQRLQLFFHRRANATTIDILDECGALFTQADAPNEPRFLLLQYYRFLSSMARLLALRPGSDDRPPLLEPEFFELTRDRTGGWSAHPLPPPKLGELDDYMELKLVAGSEAGDPLVSLHCGGQEFVALEHGDDLFRMVVDTIRRRRKSGENYPIYLTALELVDAIHRPPPSGVEILRLKRRVEERLNRTLRERLREGRV